MKEGKKKNSDDSVYVQTSLVTPWLHINITSNTLVTHITSNTLVTNITSNTLVTHITNNTLVTHITNNTLVTHITSNTLVTQISLANLVTSTARDVPFVYRHHRHLGHTQIPILSVACFTHTPANYTATSDMCYTHTTLQVTCVRHRDQQLHNR